MRRTGANEIHSEAFSARIEAAQELRAAGGKAAPDVVRLHASADKLSEVSGLYGLAPNAIIYGAFGEFTKIAALLIEWRSSVLDAVVDAQRFKIAAKVRATAWLKAYGSHPALAKLAEVASAVGNIENIDEVQAVATKIGGVPLPIGIYALPDRDTLRARSGFEGASESDRPAPPPDLAVAFVKFSIDGKPLNEVHYVSPGEAHDMDVEVRVSRWPKDATHLALEPVTVEPSGTYHLPKFQLDAPAGEEGPFRLSSQGRMILSVPNHIHARPFEFKYAARFIPSGTEQPVEVIGQRTLLLEGVDIGRSPLTGYPGVDKRLIDVRNQLRVVPHVDQRELADALTAAFALGNYAGQVIQDNLYDAPVGEAEFQRRARSFLRGHPSIGSELEEHPHVAGGITDISFRGIPIELKSETEQLMSLKECERFVPQAASYTVGTNKHIGILCVLDSSKKQQPPFPAEDGIAIFQHQHPNGSPVYIITFLLQGNLAKPSSFSR
jgi:hypothetical protein